MYRQVDGRIVDAPRAIVGSQNVLVSREDLEPYTHDEVAGLRTAPAVVVKATRTDQVASIMKLAQAERTPVTPRGAGTGLSAGAVPVCGGIVLSLEKMNRCAGCLLCPFS